MFHTGEGERSKLARIDDCVGSKVVAPGPDPPHGASSMFSFLPSMSVALVGLLSLSMIWISA